MTKIQNKIIQTNEPTFDSIRIYIPLSKLTIIDKTFTNEFYKYYLGEEQPREEPNKPEDIIIIKNGYKLRIGNKALNISGFNKKESIPTKCISTVITSKLLGKKYFEGITEENLKTIYKALMELKIFQCDYNTFKNAKYSDTDICENRYTTNKIAWNTILKDLILQSGTKQKFFNHFKEENNLGLDINTRQKAKPSTPYIKFYHKESELKSDKNKEFYNKYIKNDYSESLKNLTRVEATIKNSAHRKRLVKKGIISEYKTLGELVTMPKKEMHKVIVSSLNEYIIKIKRSKAVNLSPTEHIIFEMIQNQIQLGMSYDDILRIKDSFEGNTIKHTKQSKWRIKSIINKLFDLSIHKNKKLEQKSILNNEVKSYLKHFGINHN